MVDAREYHERTKHSPESVRNQSVQLDPGSKPRPYKVYENRPREELPGIRPPQIPALSAIAESFANPGCEIEELSSPDERTTRSVPTLQDVATLCYESSGVVQRATLEDGRTVEFRAASCTGKLYHIDLYLVVGDVDGLAPGVYHFDPKTFGLDVLREGDFRDVLVGATGTGEGVSQGTGVASAPLSIVATSTWWRNAWKYRARTYRHAFWDTGTVLANLLATSYSMDLRCSTVSAFADDAIVELLGIESEHEAPIAIVPVGQGAEPPEPIPVPSVAPNTVPPSSERTAYPLIVDAWEQSTLGHGEAADEWRKRVRRATWNGPTKTRTEQSIDLKSVGPEVQSKRPLAATIRRRRSSRHYEETGPTKQQVATVLDRATRRIPADWSSEDDAGLSFNEIYLLCTGVEGMPGGKYQYHPDDSSIDRLDGCTKAEKRHLALDQRWAGEAHVNVYLMADVDSVVSTLGNRGYRAAQLEAGVVLGRLYLGTYAHRTLGGTGLTFFDDLVTVALSPRAENRTPTCLFSFGHAAE